MNKDLDDFVQEATKNSNPWRDIAGAGSPHLMAAAYLKHLSQEKEAEMTQPEETYEPNLVLMGVRACVLALQALNIRSSTGDTEGVKALIRRMHLDAKRVLQDYELASPEPEAVAESVGFAKPTDAPDAPMDPQEVLNWPPAPPAKVELPAIYRTHEYVVRDSGATAHIALQLPTLESFHESRKCFAHKMAAGSLLSFRGESVFFDDRWWIRVYFNKNGNSESGGEYYWVSTYDIKPDAELPKQATP